MEGFQWNRGLPCWPIWRDEKGRTMVLRDIVLSSPKWLHFLTKKKKFFSLTFLSCLFSFLQFRLWTKPFTPNRLVINFTVRVPNRMVLTPCVGTLPVTHSAIDKSDSPTSLVSFASRVEVKRRLLLLTLPRKGGDFVSLLWSQCIFCFSGRWRRIQPISSVVDQKKSCTF